MNILLWIGQGLLALHTIMGAVWKFSHTEQSVPSLSSLPHGVWLALSGFELICAVGLILPALAASLTLLAPLAAAAIACEMLLFVAVHLSSGASEHGQMIYWLVVAAICAAIAYGRWSLSVHG